MHIKHFSIKIRKVNCNLEARLIQITLHNALKDIVQSWTMQLLIKISGCKDEYNSNLAFNTTTSFYTLQFLRAILFQLLNRPIFQVTQQKKPKM